MLGSRFASSGRSQTGRTRVGWVSEPLRSECSAPDPSVIRWTPPGCSCPPLPSESACSNVPSTTYVKPSTSACGCIGQSAPATSRSSLKTRSGPMPICCGSRYRSNEKCQRASNHPPCSRWMSASRRISSMCPSPLPTLLRLVPGRPFPIVHGVGRPEEIGKLHLYTLGKHIDVRLVLGAQGQQAALEVQRDLDAGVLQDPPGAGDALRIDPGRGHGLGRHVQHPREVHDRVPRDRERPPGLPRRDALHPRKHERRQIEDRR